MAQSPVILTNNETPTEINMALTTAKQK